MTTDAQPNTPGTLDFLMSWLPEGPWTVIADNAGKWPGHPIASFRSEQLNELVAWLEEHNGRDNCYFVRNIPHPNARLTSTPKAEQIAFVVGVSIDVDLAKRGASQEDYDELFTKLQSLPTPPTVIVFTGGGYQAHWRFTNPLPAETHREAAEALGKQLAASFSGDPVQAISSLMRLPGTVNVLNDTKRATGRKPATAYVAHEDWSNNWELGDVTTTQTERPNTLSDLPVEWRDRIRTGSIDWLDGNDRSRSAALYRILLFLLRRGWTDEQITAVFLDRNNGIAESVLEKSNPERYITTQISHAKARVAQEFIKDDKGKILPNNYENIKKALNQLEYSLSYDQFSHRHLYFHPSLDRPHRIDDNFLGDMRIRHIPERFHFSPSANYFVEAIPTIARENTYHPVHDYLSPLAWDGTPRLDTWLTTYGQAPDTPYTRAVGKLILIAAIARIRTPGVKFDEMLVLQGKQGTSKSTALQILAVRHEWFTDSAPLAGSSREILEALLGKWIIEFAELSGIHKRTIEELKSFLTRTYDRGRLAYGRVALDWPRSCVFFGTTNSDTYLIDETNRRFWPVTVGTFDLAALARDRDQIWAEAATLHAAGHPIRLDPSLYSAASQEQEERRITDPWRDLLANHFADPAMHGKVAISDLWQIVNKPTGYTTHNDNQRISAAMRELGWTRKHTSFPGNRSLKYCYVRGNNFHEVNRPLYVIRDPLTGAIVVTHEQNSTNPPPYSDTINEIPF